MEMEELGNGYKKYKGKYFDLIVSPNSKLTKEEIELKTSDEYQERQYQEALNDCLSRYGETLKRLKDL